MVNGLLFLWETCVCHRWEEGVCVWMALGNVALACLDELTTRFALQWGYLRWRQDCVFHHMSVAALINTGRDVALPLLDRLCQNILAKWEETFGTQAGAPSQVHQAMLLKEVVASFAAGAWCASAPSPSPVLKFLSLRLMFRQ